MIVSIVLGADGKKQKEKKKEAVCDVCCKFRARRNKVTHCLTSGVQPKLFKCLCSNSFWLRPFRGSLWQATSSSYLFKQEANLSLAVLPFFDIAIVGRENAKRARSSDLVRKKRNTNHYPQSLACATVKFSVEAPMSFVLWAGIQICEGTREKISDISVSWAGRFVKEKRITIFPPHCQRKVLKGKPVAYSFILRRVKPSI